MKKFLLFLPSVWILLLLLQHPHADVAVHTCELRRMGGDDIMERRLLDALVLTLLELRKLQFVRQKQSNGRCHVVCLYPYAMLHSHCCARVAALCVYTYRRGVCVARFDEQGNAKASKG